VELLAPVDGLTEVWAAGVTYLWSREARALESGGFSSAYESVYDAARPELFFKSAAWRVVGPGAAVAIREDSTINVPEPELALVINKYGEIAGYTVCDDLSSRSIEGENPLYLPQAKVYMGGCALGPMIRPVWEVADPYQLTIEACILRAGEVVWSGEASTSQLNRRFEDLIEYLFRADDFPAGVVLSTGTCLVPPLPFSLLQGDQIIIEISDVGKLENTVVRGKAAMARSSPQ
jgi:2-dehydro-3-deoxy-D-arabinonate dehydratase